ncbi:MAG: DUF1810 domain-containing protein [Bacteroidia bacterium]|jgi:uncharacterized protein (DUF1810 family)
MSTIDDPFKLNRFILAQEITYHNALLQIKSAKKTGHWMWYVFPQVKGLGITSRSLEYSIKSPQEAKAYLQHPVLGARLIEISAALIEHKDKTAETILGYTDSLKLKSSMTLFHQVSENHTLFDAVLKQFFKGESCSFTLAYLNQNQ